MEQTIQLVNCIASEGRGEARTAWVLRVIAKPNEIANLPGWQGSRINPKGSDKYPRAFADLNRGYTQGVVQADARSMIVVRLQMGEPESKPGTLILKEVCRQRDSTRRMRFKPILDESGALILEVPKDIAPSAIPNLANQIVAIFVVRGVKMPRAPELPRPEVLRKQRARSLERRYFRTIHACAGLQ